MGEVVEVTEGKRDFRGVFSLLLTPFDEAGAIDYTVYDEYVDWQLSHHPTGVFAVCGSSEMKWLEKSERLALARRAVKRAGDTPVIATANLGEDVGEHADEMNQMIETGVSGVVLVPSPGMASDVNRFEDYLASLIDHASVPVFLYEWPQVQPYEVPADLFGRLSKQHGLAGIKDTTCTMSGIQAKIHAASPDTVVYQANNPFLLDAIEAGARGIMGVTSAAGADLVVKMWEAAIGGQQEDAAQLHREVTYLDAVQRYAYPASAKRLAQLRGIPMSLRCRWPITVPDEAMKAIEVWYRGQSAR